MRIFIITEGTPETGMGHLSRCSSLYDAFREKGFHPEFIVNGGQGALDFLGIREASCFDWTKDPEMLARKISGADIAVMDSYIAWSELYELIAEKVKLLVCIDDYARLDYPKGMVVNGTVGITDQLYSVKEGVSYLTGNDYVMLRKEFWDVPSKIINSDIRKILVTMGGGDTTGLIEDITGLLSDDYMGAELHIVTGNNTQADSISGNFHTYGRVNAKVMKELMQECDVAISSAGQTSNELARCGVPSLLIPTADNQRNNIEGWIKAGFIENPSRQQTLLSDLKKLSDASLRRKFSQAGSKAVDGRGALRVAVAAIRESYLPELHVRRAGKQDLMSLFCLANDPEVRSNSYDMAAIELEEHKNWFSRMMSSGSDLLYVFEIGKDFAGQVRFGVKSDETVISVSIARHYRGHGLGAEILNRALLELEKELPRHPVVTAYIKDNNKASQRAFAKAGFHHVSGEKWEIKR